MKRLLKPSKMDMLVDMFDTVGKVIKLEEVLQVTGIKNYGSLKALFSHIRKAPHIPNANRIDVRIQGNICKRVE